MKRFLNYAGKRFFVALPLYVTLPVFVAWVLSVYFAIFGETEISASYWFRAGSIITMIIASLAIIFRWDRK